MICEIFISTFCPRLGNFSKLCGASLCSQWRHVENGGSCEKAKSEESEMEGGVGGFPKGARSLWGDGNRLLKCQSATLQTGTGNSFQTFTLQVFEWKRLNPERNAAVPLCGAALTGVQWDVLGARPALGTSWPHVSSKVRQQELQRRTPNHWPLESLNDGKMCLNWVTNIVKAEELPQMDWETKRFHWSGCCWGGSSWSTKN